MTTTPLPRTAGDDRSARRNDRTSVRPSFSSTTPPLLATRDEDEQALRQRERVRIARTREQEILKRLSQLDELGTGARRRHRRRYHRSRVWRVAHPAVFTRPPLETMPPAELEDAAHMLGNRLTEARGMRLLAYRHAGIFGCVTLPLAFAVTLSGPTFLSSFLRGGAWSGGGSHRVTVLLRHARAYQGRLAAIERARWDARVLLRERREEV